MFTMRCMPGAACRLLKVGSGLLGFAAVAAER